MIVDVTIVSRFVIYALRRIGVTADDRARVPLLYERYGLDGHIRRGGELVPVRIDLHALASDDQRTRVIVDVAHDEVAATVSRILDGYRPEADPVRTLERRRERDERERQRRLQGAGWTGQGTMPSAALDVVMAGFDEPTEDPVASDSWLRFLWDVRLSSADRDRLVPWLLDRFVFDELEDDRFLMAELVARFARPRRYADRVVALAEERRYGYHRRGIVRAVRTTTPERAGPVLVALCEDATVRDIAIESLGRTRDGAYSEAVRPFLKDGDARVRRAARAALKRMGVDVPAPPKPVHRVSARTTFDPSFEEWSTNLDLERLPEVLTVVAAWGADGFGEAEILELLVAVEHQAVGSSRTFRFPDTGGPEDLAIGIRIHLDDEDSVDLNVWGPDDLRSKLDDWWKRSER